MFGTAGRPLTMRLGRVAIRSVAATTNGTPAELGSTNTIRRRNPRAARIASTTLEPTPFRRHLDVPGVDEMPRCRIGFDR